MVDDRSAAASRARARGVTQPWHRTNQLLTALILIFVLSSATGTGAFVIVFHRISTSAKVAYEDQCQSNNETREGALKGLDKQVVRSKASLGPLLANPSTTGQQKTAAVRNYNGLKTFVDGEHKSLPQKDCSYPPLAPVNTSSPTSSGR